MTAAAVIETASKPHGDGRFTPETGRAAGRRGGRARRKLNLDRVDAELPRFDTVDEIRRGCELIQRWACAGMVTGATAGAAVRAAEIGLKALEASATFEAIEELGASVAELKAERDELLRQVETLQAQLGRRTA